FVQLVCMPLVAFDQQGNRLGMGGGFYDRTLAFMHQPGQQPALLGCAYDWQKTTALAAEPWDIPLSAIATDQRLYRFRKRMLLSRVEICTVFLLSAEMLVVKAPNRATMASKISTSGLRIANSRLYTQRLAEKLLPAILKPD